MKRFLVAMAWTFVFAPAVVFCEDTAEDRPMPGLYDYLHARCVDVLIEGRLDGSGSVVDPGGIVLTAAHVVGLPGHKVEVNSKTLGRLPAEVIAIDYGHDLCLLQLPKREQPYQALSLAAAWPEPTTPVYLFGNPFFRREVLLAGRVARKRHTYEYIGWEGNNKSFIAAMHIAGMTPPGVSGAPWVNGRGEVLGLQSSAMKIEGSMQGLASVAPLAAIARLLEARGHAKTCTMQLAVEEIFAQSREFISQLPADARGVICVQVQSEGAGGKAGIRDQDILATIDGRNVEGVDWLLDYIRSKQPGEVVRCVVFDSRYANPREIDVPLACLEAKWHEQPKPATQTTGSP